MSRKGKKELARAPKSNCDVGLFCDIYFPKCCDGRGSELNFLF